MNQPDKYMIGRILLAKLRNLKGNARLDLFYSERVGICPIVRHSSPQSCASTEQQVSVLLYTIMSTWHKFSGDYYYPIPIQRKDLTPEQGYHRYAESHSLWKGEQGKFRLELVDFVIEELEKMEKERTKIKILDYPGHDGVDSLERALFWAAGAMCRYSTIKVIPVMYFRFYDKVFRIQSFDKLVEVFEVLVIDGEEQIFVSPRTLELR